MSNTRLLCTSAIGRAAAILFNLALLSTVSIGAAVAQTAPRPEKPAAAPMTQPLEVPAEYVIGAEDVLGVVFWKDTEMTGDVTVRPDGKITLPLIGDILAAGLSTVALKAEIEKAASKIQQEPSVTVVVRQINSRKVFITGQVTTPGTFPLTGPRTVMQLISVAGGLTEYADKKNITVIRLENGRQQIFKFNYSDVAKGKNLDQNIVLKPGDTVVVPSVGMKNLIPILALAALCTPSLVDAQTVPRPARPYRGLFGGGPPPDPNRTRQELTFNGSLLGGYDETISPGSGGGGGIQPGQLTVSGYTGTVDMRLEYFIGRAAKSLAVDGHGWTTAYRGPSIDPSTGGDLSVHGEIMARRNRLTFDEDVAYAPFLVLGTFDALPLPLDVDAGVLPDSGNTGGLTYQRSMSTNTVVDVERQFTARQSISAGYNYSRRDYLDDFGHDSDAQVVNSLYAWSLNRRWRLETSYRYSDLRFIGRTPDGGAVEDGEPPVEEAPEEGGEEGGEEGPVPPTGEPAPPPEPLGPPLNNHALQFGFSYTRDLSPTRQVRVSGSVGTAYVRTLSDIDRTPLEYWTPSGNASLRADVGRSWAISADYARAVSALQGVTLESFATDATSLRAEGLIGSRSEAVFSVGYSNGRSATGEYPSRFSSYGGSAQFRYAFARCCAASVGYHYYYYRLQEVAGLPSGLPTEDDAQALRFGVSFWVPFFRTYVDRGRSRPVGGAAR